MTHQKLSYILSIFHKLSQGGILWKDSPRGTSRMFFSLYTGVASAIYVRTTSFKLILLRNITVSEALLLRVPVWQWNKYPTQFNLKKVKRRKLNSLIVHCEKLPTSLIGFYSIRIWTLNKQCSHGEIGEIAIRKDFSLKFFHKKALPWQFSKIKRKFLFAHRLVFFFFKKIKWF